MLLFLLLLFFFFLSCGSYVVSLRDKMEMITRTNTGTKVLGPTDLHNTIVLIPSSYQTKQGRVGPGLVPVL